MQGGGEFFDEIPILNKLREGEKLFNEIVDENVIYLAYKIFLGREPINEEIVRRQAKRFKYYKEIRDYFLQSEEWSLLDSTARKKSISVDKDIVIWTYRLIIFKDPSNRDINEHIGIKLYDLVNKLVASSHFKRSYDSNVKIILGKSMPRSGHHFLINILSNYFLDDFHYCEFYKPTYCCRTIPCQKSYEPNKGNKFFIQKSHDFRFQDEFDNKYNYIIQYRHPVPRVQSNFELALKVPGNKWSDDKRSFFGFMKKEAEYFVKFYNKWIHKPPIKSEIILYENLLNNTDNELSRLINFITDSSVNKYALKKALAFKAYNPHTDNEFSPRIVENHRYYDPSFYREVEEMVFARCPKVAFSRLYS